MCVCVLILVAPDSVQPYGLQPARLLCPWGFLGKNTGVGCHTFLQGIFPTQGSNPYLLHLSALTSGSCTTSAMWEALYIFMYLQVYACLNHFSVQLKLTQYFKSTILQFLKRYS